MPPSDPHRQQVKIRRTQCTQMVIAGVDWQTIADRLYEGDVAFAHTDYWRAKKEIAAQLTTTVEEARELELDRLRRLLAGVWTKATKGDTKAADTAHRIIQTLIKTQGLEAPTQIQLDARVDLESSVVAEAVIAAIDALGLAPDQRIVAFDAAQKRLELVSGGGDDEDEVV